jgi:hypothetical protein
MRCSELAAIISDNDFIYINDGQSNVKASK